MQTISWILLFSMIFYCCTSTHMVLKNPSAYDELNEELRGRKGKIILLNNDIIEGENVKIGIDSTCWVEKQTTGRYSYEQKSAYINWSLPTSEVRAIAIKNKGSGALEGLGLGALSGAGIGLGWGYIEYSRLGGRGMSGLAIPVGLFLGATIGALLGLAYGLSKGHTHKYVVTTLADSTSTSIESEK